MQATLPAWRISASRAQASWASRWLIVATAGADKFGKGKEEIGDITLSRCQKKTARRSGRFRSYQFARQTR
jgi:hypothetical protein